MGVAETYLHPIESLFGSIQIAEVVVSQGCSWSSLHVYITGKKTDLHFQASLSSLFYRQTCGL